MIKLKNIVNESTPNQIIKDLDKARKALRKKANVLIAKKKKLYSDVDIESPMSADEKKLNKDIADLFSQINKLVLQKRRVKKESVNETKDNFMNESYVSWDTSLSSLMKDTNNLRSYVNDIKNPKTKRNSLTKVKAIQKHLQTIENLFSDIDKDIDDDELSRGKFI